VATTLKATFVPATTVWLCGGVTITGGVSTAHTLNSAAALSTEPTALLTTTE